MQFLEWIPVAIFPCGQQLFINVTMMPLSPVGCAKSECVFKLKINLTWVGFNIFSFQFQLRLKHMNFRSVECQDNPGKGHQAEGASPAARLNNGLLLNF